MQKHELLFLITAFISEVLGTIGGFGSSTFFVPLALQFESFEVVLVLTSFLHVAGNLTKIFLFRKDFNFKLIFKLAIPSVLMALVGASLVKTFNSDLLTRFLGFFLLLLLLIKIFFEKKLSSKNVALQTGLIASSGFLTGLFGTGGALRALALSSMGLSKSIFIVTSASIDVLGDIGRLFIYLKDFSLEKEHWFYLPALMIVAWFGSWIGKWILQFVSEKKFQWIVGFMIFAVALYTIVTGK